jgi:hypothetical protein
MYCTVRYINNLPTLTFVASTYLLLDTKGPVLGADGLQRLTGLVLVDPSHLYLVTCKLK